MIYWCIEGITDLRWVMDAGRLSTGPENPSSSMKSPADWKVRWVIEGGDCPLID